MKRTIATIAATITLLLTALPGAWALDLGDSAPLADKRMKNVDGSMVSIASAAGEKGTLVIFGCNHCPWVVAWQDRIAALGNAAMTQGVGVIMVNSNDPKAYPSDDFDGMVKRAEEVGYQFPYVVDDDSGVAKAFGAKHTPEAFLFNREGKLVYHGTIDDNAQNPEQVEKRYLKEAVDAVVAGNAVPTPQTKALGCSIKFRS